MADDEVEKLRAALAHAYDQKQSRVRALVRRIAAPLKRHIQKRAIVERLEPPPKKKSDAA